MSSPSIGRKPVRLYLPATGDTGHPVNAEISLSTAQYRHLITALRRGAGDLVEWFDGMGVVGAGRLVGSDRTGFAVQITTAERVPVEAPGTCELILGIPRPDALDQALEGAVQAGVGRITLIPAHRTPWPIPAAKRPKLLERWRQTVIDSAEQSGRITVPAVAL
ncbi:MAG TPA: RsmE family RNA methyltransferase, partial [bacterium]|nr:RsmE family RNA methyltransferase [bacterium]